MNFPQQLLAGYRAFRQNRLPAEQQRYRELAETGQRPEVMIIGCCDSRVSPEVIFDSRPGELFVVRNVANLVPPYSPTGFTHGVSAAIEFAVQVLEVRHIVVLGHARCGGVRAYVEQGEPLSERDFIGQWISLLSPAADSLGARGEEPLEPYLSELEQVSITKSLDNLAGFPFVRDRLADGRLQLHGAYFDVATGLISIGNPDTGTFEEVDGA